MEITVTEIGQSRTQATVIFAEDAVRDAEEQVIKILGKEVEIEGFRPGTAPVEKLREKIPADRIQEESIHKMLPEAMKKILEEHKLEPIIRPTVELKEVNPMTIVIVFVEKPKVQVKGADKIKVPKKKEEKKKEEALTEGEKKEETKEDAEMRKAYEERQDQMERERQLFDLIEEKTVVDIAPELIDDEMRQIIDQQMSQLQQQGIEFDAWLQQIGKTTEEFLDEVRPAAKKRLTIRFGVSQLIDDWEIEVAEEEMKESIETFLAGLPKEYQEQLRPMYEPGTKQFEQFRSQKLVDKVVEKILGK